MSITENNEVVAVKHYCISNMMYTYYHAYHRKLHQDYMIFEI